MSRLKLMFPTLILLISFSSLLAQSKADTTLQTLNSIEGTWSIDLRPTPDSNPYLKEFKLKLKNDTTFEGEFYDSPIYNGLLNKNWDKVYFAFYTRDSSNEYFHAGYWMGDQIFGTTYCPDRDFVAPWTGARVDAVE